MKKKNRNRKSSNYKRFVKAKFGQRYNAINFTNEHTIEIRIFKGNLKSERILKNIEYLFAMKNFCEISKASEIHLKKFVGFIKNNKKEYPNLNAFLFKFGKSLKEAIIKDTKFAQEMPLLGKNN